jgi:hypothetical protein
VAFATGTSGVAGSKGYCLKAGNIPPLAFSPGPGQVMVGLDDYYKSGTNPFPCDDVRAENFRAGVVFDLSKFDIIGLATLRFDTASSIDRTNGETIGRIPGTSMATMIGIATGPFTTAMPANNDVPLPSGGNISVDVSSQVNDWVSKSRPNFGFVIWGPRGDFDRGNPPEDNDAKLSFYQNFQLEILFNPDRNPNAPK